MPGSIYMSGEDSRWSHEFSHPPVWPIAVQDYADQTTSDELISQYYQPLVRQIRWFEANRQAEPIRVFLPRYPDIPMGKRRGRGRALPQAQPGPYACVDATSTYTTLYRQAAQWAKMCSSQTQNGGESRCTAGYIQNDLWDDEQAGFTIAGRRTSQKSATPPLKACFRWSWARPPDSRPTCYRGKPAEPAPLLHPAPDQHGGGRRLPIRTAHVARPGLEQHDLLGGARLPAQPEPPSRAGLTRTRPGPYGGSVRAHRHNLGVLSSVRRRPEDLMRKPQTQYNQPCRDYLGHNPLIAMARLWQRVATPY